jgi:hypothetical protein
MSLGRRSPQGDNGAQAAPVRAQATEAAEAASEGRFDAKAFKRALNKNLNYNRNGFGYKEEMLAKMSQEYTSEHSCFSSSELLASSPDK